MYEIESAKPNMLRTKVDQTAYRIASILQNEGKETPQVFSNVVQAAMMTYIC